MSIVFNADEVFGMAEQMERNGGAFYRRAAEHNQGVRDLLLEIASQEDQHLTLFTAMRGELGSADSVETAYDPDGEGAMYLKEFVGGYVFPVDVDPDTIIKPDAPVADVIRVAIGAEKDAVVFYLGVRDMVPESLGRDRIDAIIKEEMGHIRWLSAQLH